jgi:hypothetical protein
MPDTPLTLKNMPLRHYFRHADITPLPLFEDYDACHYADARFSPPPLIFTPIR